MAKEFLTDDAVELEIAKLTASEEVRLARREQRLKYKRRQTLYTLRALAKRGEELMNAGISLGNIDAMIAIAEAESSEDEEK